MSATTTKSTPFDITQDADMEHGIQLDFPQSKIAPIYENNMIHGRITPSSTANLTLLKNSYALNTCVATHFYIVGNNNGGSLSNLQLASGNSYFDETVKNYAELIIECSDTKTSKKFRLCHLLFMAKKGTPGSESLSSMITTLQTASAGTTPPTSVDFGTAIDGANTTAIQNNPNIKKSYVLYENASYTYIISTVPINLTASLLFDNNNMIDFGKDLTKKYTMINMVNDTEWMECEYSNLPGEKVTQLLPLRNITDVNADQSFRQIVLFLVFVIALVIFYFVIPPLYQMILWKLAKNDLNSMCTTMFYLDLIGNSIFATLWILLGIAGVNSTQDGSGSIQSAFIIFIMHMITVGTISVSRISPNFPFEGREQRCAQKPTTPSGGSSSSNLMSSNLMSMYH